MEEDAEGQVPKWSWLGEKSPLMTLGGKGGEMAEAEWVVRQLSRRLERSLGRVVRERRKRDGGVGETEREEVVEKEGRRLQQEAEREDED